MLSDGLREWAQLTFTVADGGTARARTEVLDLGARRPAAVLMPAAWAAASLSFRGHPFSQVNTDLQDIYDEGGEVTVTTVAANRLVMFTDTAVMLENARYLQLRSGLTAAPVTQAAATSVYLLLLPVE